jgi:hypothetical protein
VNHGRGGGWRILQRRESFAYHLRSHNGGILQLVGCVRAQNSEIIVFSEKFGQTKDE